jgi:hypothetical protein
MLSMLICNENGSRYICTDIYVYVGSIDRELMRSGKNSIHYLLSLSGVVERKMLDDHSYG